MSCAPLWQRALASRRPGFKPGDPRAVEAGRKGGRKGGRKYPVLKVGDASGGRTVIKLLPRDFTSNERVMVQCANGHEGDLYAFQFRKAKRCPRCPRGWQRGRGLRLDDDLVRAILFSAGTQLEIANRFEISQSTVSRLFRSWRTRIAKGAGR